MKNEIYEFQFGAISKKLIRIPYDKKTCRINNSKQKVFKPKTVTPKSPTSGIHNLKYPASENFFIYVKAPAISTSYVINMSNIYFEVKNILAKLRTFKISKMRLAMYIIRRKKKPDQEGITGGVGVVGEEQSLRVYLSAEQNTEAKPPSMLGYSTCSNTDQLRTSNHQQKHKLSHRLRTGM